MNDRLRFDAIGMVTGDLSATLDFYRRLGLELPQDAQGPHVEATLPGGMRLMWDTAESVRRLDPSWVAPTGQNATLCVLCDSPATVDEVHAQLLSDGAPNAMEPFNAPWGQRYAAVLDPDGYQVQLFAWQ